MSVSKSRGGDLLILKQPLAKNTSLTRAKVPNNFLLCSAAQAGFNKNGVFLITNFRAFLKTQLKNTPGLYRLAKLLYEQYKKRIDTWRTLAIHPDVEVVNFSRQKIERLHAEHYKSQFGQDYYLLKKIFANHSSGSFIEIGANHPIKNNNSYAFEKAGWTGWAFDPLSRFRESWQSEREAAFILAALSDANGKRLFVEFEGNQGWEHKLSGFADSVRPEDLKIHSHRTYEVECHPLDYFLPNLSHVDLALIDVEGAELSVIAGLGLDKIQIDWILVENVMKLGGDEKVREVLLKKGYIFRARIASTDDLFQRL